jgi:hypothetical protein
VSLRWISLFVLVAVLVLRAQNSQIGLTFEELEAFLKENSPQWKLFEQNISLEKESIQIDMQWTNPQFAFQFEDVSDNGTHLKETALTLEKKFEMPWIYSKRRQSWIDQLHGASFTGQQLWNVFLAKMRSGYVELALLDNQERLLKNMKSVLEIISGTANSRYSEGAISGLEQNLIQMTLFNIESAIVQLSQRRLDLENEWKSLAGIAQEKTLDLQSKIVFLPVSQNEELFSKSVLETNVGLLAREHYQRALEKRIDLEKMKVLPDVTFAGGYKEISPGFKGYTLALSMPIPLLNQNNPQIEKQQIEFSRYQIESDIYRNQLTGQVKAKQQMILAYESALQNISEQTKNKLADLDQIITSYQEGWISLSDMLNAIKIYYDFIQDYNNQLINYYLVIFQLESLIDKRFIKL